MRFLHEFCNPVNPNCKRYDNGWWQIDGDRFITPYRIEVGENVYMFVSRQAELRGQSFDRIDNCTTFGIPERIRVCERVCEL